MPRGVHRSKRTPGNKQRKVQKQKKEYADSIAGSLLQYVKKPGDGRQGSSKDIECQSPVDKGDSSDASMHSLEAQSLDMAEFEIREEGLETEFVESISDSDHSVNTDLRKNI